MKDLNDAEVLVETRLSLNSGEPCGTWFGLSDYSTIGEFFVDCAAWFDEENPEYVYAEWENIPDGMINRHWISPNLFEFRDALQNIEESQLGAFWKWCTTWGWNPATNEPNKIVADFMESTGGVHSTKDEEPTYDEPEYLFMYDAAGSSFDIFDDGQIFIYKFDTVQEIV